MSGRQRKKRIATLKRRAAHLEKRIAAADRDRGFDKAELSALEWAISELEALYPELADELYSGAGLAITIDSAV